MCLTKTIPSKVVIKNLRSVRSCCPRRRRRKRKKLRKKKETANTDEGKAPKIGRINRDNECRSLWSGNENYRLPHPDAERHQFLYRIYTFIAYSILMSCRKLNFMVFDTLNSYKTLSIFSYSSLFHHKATVQRPNTIFYSKTRRDKLWGVQYDGEHITCKSCISRLRDHKKPVLWFFSHHQWWMQRQNRRPFSKLR